MTEPPRQNEDRTSERDRILSANARLHRELAVDYDRLHPHMRNSYEQHLQRRDVLKMTAHASQPHVLELGVGTGNLTMQFLEAGCRVTAVDMSAEMLRELERKVQQRGLTGRCDVTQADVDTFLAADPRTGFDVIAMSSVAHHLPDYRSSLEALAARLAPRGYLYLIHEPAHRDELSTALLPLRRAWSVVPRGLDRVLRLFQPARQAANDQWHAQETEYVDYHYYRNGIGIADLTEVLTNRGLKLVSASRYNAHENGVVSWLDNFWFPAFRYEQFQRTYFRAIWQRAS
jgi:2-polyprenyl-3-methyl-5-hydroxy-6-metoxy-1,4-benzoquinol methylase